MCTTCNIIFKSLVIFSNLINLILKKSMFDDLIRQIRSYFVWAKARKIIRSRERRIFTKWIILRCFRRNGNKTRPKSLTVLTWGSDLPPAGANSSLSDTACNTKWENIWKRLHVDRRSGNGVVKTFTTDVYPDKRVSTRVNLNLWRAECAK